MMVFRIRSPFIFLRFFLRELFFAHFKNGKDLMSLFIYGRNNFDLDGLEAVLSQNFMDSFSFQMGINRPHLETQSIEERFEACLPDQAIPI